MDDPDLHSLPGFRFSPTDDELIDDYLKLKKTGKDNKNTRRLPVIDICKYEPWDLPSFARIPTKDKEWYYFTEQSLRHKKGNSKNRSTEKGYWKPTGTDRKIMSRGKVIGMKKTLVYHLGRSPNGEGTKYVIHEYRTTKEFDGKHPSQKDLVLIRLFDNREKSTKGGPAVSLDTTFCIEETKSKSSLAPVSPALEVQAETSDQSYYVNISDEMLSDATAPVQCKTDNYNYHNAYVAEKQEAQMTSSEDGFNVDEMMSDTTEPVQFKNDNYNYHDAYVAEKQKAEMTSSEDDCNVEKYLNMFSPSAFDFNADKMMFDATAPVQFKNDNFNSEVDFNVEENLNKFCFTPPDDSPSSLPPITPYVSAQSMLVPASMSPELGSEADNYPRCCPAESSDGITPSAIPPIEYNGYYTYVSKKEVAEIASDEVEAGLNMFPVTPQPLDIDVAFPKLTRLIVMQRAFVICRLFKKQDLSIEVSNHDEAAVSPKDTQLELDPVSPSLGGQAGNDPTSVECFPAENSDASTSDTVAPVNCNKGNSVVTENQGGELPENDPTLEDDLGMFFDPQFKPQDWILFSPSHAQIQELGHLYAPNDLNSGKGGVTSQYGPNEQDDIAAFLDSVIRDPDEYSYVGFGNQKNLAYESQALNVVSVKDKGSCSVSDAEAVNAPHFQGSLKSEDIIDRKAPLQNPISSSGASEQMYDYSLKESSNHLTAASSGEVRTRITIRHCSQKIQPRIGNSMAQGSAPRRTRLQCKLQVQPLTSNLVPEDWRYTTGDHELKPVDTDEENTSEKHAVAGDHSASATTNAFSEPENILSNSIENYKTSQELSTSPRPILRFNSRSNLTGFLATSLFPKASPVRHSNWSLAILFRVVLVAVLFISFASIWRC